LSFNVLVIPEDFRNDQYILKPLVQAMLAQLGKPRAKVSVLTDPLLGGVDVALNLAQLESIVDRYRNSVNLFLLVIDRDGNAGRRQRLDAIEAHFRSQAAADDFIFFAENAWQELEVLALAGMTDLPERWLWREVRAHRDPKEAYFRPYAATRQLTTEPGEGRKTIGAEAARRYDRVRNLCQEDVLALEQKILAHYNA